MRWSLKTLLFLIFILIPSVGFSKTVYFGAGSELVPVNFGQETLLKFPQDVRTISRAEAFEIAPANKDSPNYSLLKIRPRISHGARDVLFILVDQSVVRVKFLITPNNGNGSDSIYEFVSKTVSASNSQNGGPEVSGIDLMKALIRGDEVSGFQIHSPNILLEKNIKRINVTLLKKYVGTDLVGYIFKIENKSSREKVLVNIKGLTIGDPNLAILSSIEHPVLDPKSTGQNQVLLRIVAKNISGSNDLTLPTEIVERK
jgi:hypothetical protein